MQSKIVPAGGVSLLALFFMSCAASAANFMVNDAGSGSDAAINGICEVTPGVSDCSLRAAIQEANAAAGFDKITFGPAAVQIVLTNALPKITSRVFIDGSTGNAASPRVSISGSNGTFSCLELESDIGADVEQPADTTFPAANSRIENLVLGDCDGPGISVIGHGYLVRNNVVGLNAAQSASAPNDAEGILVSANAGQGAVPATFPNVTVPPPATLDTPEAIATYLQAMLPATFPPTGVIGNIVGGNRRIGIRIVSQYATATVIADNKVGVAGDGVSMFPNGTDGGADAHGIAIQAPAYFNFIQGNIVAGQNGNANSSGIVIDSPLGFPLPNVVSGNYVGLSPTNPALDLGNSLSGIVVNNSIPLANVNPLGLSTIVGPGNKVGFNRGVPGADLVNSQNGGIFLSAANTASTNIRVYANEVGAMTVGGALVSAPNASHGINVVGNAHVIGGATPAEGNLVGNNGGHGIDIRGNNSDFGVQVRNNRIGTGPAGEDVGNTLGGIRVWSGGHTIGENIIANNGRHAVQLSSSNAWSDLVTRNSIFATAAGFFGIDLDGTVDAPDAADASGNVVDRSNSAKNYTNWQQNAPVLSNPAYDAATQMVSVTYALASAPATQYRLELFSNDVAQREGRDYLGMTTLTTGAADANGWGSITGTLSVAAPATLPGKYLTATITDIADTSAPFPPGAMAAGPANNTSEFSAPVLVPAGPAAGQVEFVSATYSALESAGTATITVRRVNGTAGAISVAYASVAGGSATVVTDYQAATGTLNWADGQAADQSFPVTLVDDPTQESAETVNLQLSNPTGGATLGAQAAATLSITDDDDPAAMGIKTYTGPASTGSGNVTAQITGGGNACGFDLAQTSTIGAPPGNAPVPPSLPQPGLEFPHGMLRARLINCAPGSTIAFTVTYPAAPAVTQGWRYGPSAAPAWSDAGMPAANVLQFSAIEGGISDDDQLANGTLVIGALGVSAPGAIVLSQPSTIPANDSWSLLALTALLGLGAMLATRRFASK